MICLFRLCLILSLSLTGFALASARGQAVLGERVVLCSGHVVILTYGPDGTPGESPHFCPDMALNLLAATAAQGDITPRLARVQPAIFAMRGVSVTTAFPIHAQARDPPFPGLG